MSKSKDVEYVVTLDGCRVAKSPTYTQAVRLKEVLSKGYPCNMIFKVESREKDKMTHNITA